MNRTYFVTDDAGRTLAVNDDTGQIAIEEEVERVCPDCGEPGHGKGWMECQYPQD